MIHRALHKVYQIFIYMIFIYLVVFTWSVIFESEEKEKLFGIKHYFKFKFKFK